MIDFVLPDFGVLVLVTLVKWLVMNYVALFTIHVAHDVWIKHIMMLGGNGSQVVVFFRGRSSVVPRFLRIFMCSSSSSCSCSGSSGAGDHDSVETALRHHPVATGPESRTKKLALL